MKQTISRIAILIFLSLSASSAADEKPVKHLEVEDILVASEAKSVFIETTARLRSKQNLDDQELHDIHMITYSLEKAVAYYTVNSSDRQGASAEKIAEVVELIHLASENGKGAEVRIYLDEYFELADEFATEL